MWNIFGSLFIILLPSWITAVLEASVAQSFFLLLAMSPSGSNICTVSVSVKQKES